MAQLVLRLMGRFEVSKDGKRITTFETNKVRALLAYLAAEADRAHSREALAGMFWPDYPQTSAMESLRHALPALRRAIGDRLAQPPYVLITRDTVQINRKSDLQVDLWDFEQILAQQPTSSDPQASITRLRSAIDLFNGPFLDGLFCNSDIFEKWAQTRREGSNRQAYEVLSSLARIYAETGDNENSLLFARRLLDLEPWDEAAHRLVMQGLARSGLRNAALAQYETCRQTLKKELNVEPELETQRLYEVIRSGRLGITSRQETVSFPNRQAVAESPRPDLLAGWSPLIGRERELEEIARRLSSPACRLLTLVGPGGIGKTHLALETVARQSWLHPALA